MPTTDEIRDTQRQTWNKFSSGWKKWDDFVMAWLKPIGEAMLDMAYIQKEDRILDVATGTGEPGLSAARGGVSKSVTAVDVAEDMVRIAMEKAQSQGLGNFEAVPFDGLHLPFKERAFDVVLCRHGIMFFPDVAACIQELARVTKPGGRVVAAYWLAPEKNPWASAPGRIVQQTLGLPPPPPDAPGIFRCAKPGMVLELFKEAGLKSAQEKDIQGEILFQGFNHFWEFLNDVVAPVSSALLKADENARSEIRKEIQRTLESYAAAPGRLVLPWVAQITTGTW